MGKRGSPHPIDDKPERAKFMRRVVDGATDKELVEEFGVADRTIRDWRARPKIREAIAKAVDSGLQAYLIRKANAAAEAFENLLKLARSSKSETVKLAASKAILEGLDKLIELRLLIAKDNAPSSDQKSVKTLDQLRADGIRLLERMPPPPPEPDDPPVHPPVHEGNGHS